MSFTKAIGVAVPSISNRITVTSAGTESTTISLPEANTTIGLLVLSAEGGASCAPSTVLGFLQPHKGPQSWQPRASRSTSWRSHLHAPGSGEARRSPWKYRGSEIPNCQNILKIIISF